MQAKKLVNACFGAKKACTYCSIKRAIKLVKSTTIELFSKHYIEYNGIRIIMYNKERMLVELLRNKNKLPFDYYKEILGNYRNIINDLDIPEIQDYAYALPKSGMIMEALQMEVF